MAFSCTLTNWQCNAFWGSAVALWVCYCYLANARIDCGIFNCEASQKSFHCSQVGFALKTLLTSRILNIFFKDFAPLMRDEPWETVRITLFDVRQTDVNLSKISVAHPDFLKWIILTVIANQKVVPLLFLGGSASGGSL